MKIAADSYFAIVPEWLLDAEVSDKAIRVYARLARFADQAGHARPSRNTLARLCHCSTDSIDRALKELETTGALTVKRGKAEHGGWAPNEYVLRRTRPSRVAAATPSRMDAA